MKYAIIGGGIGGLTTALAFEKKGIEYTLFEKAPTLNEVGAGIWLAPNALQVLKQLEILNEVTKEGNIIDTILIGDKNLSPISLSSQEKIKEHFGFSTVAIHRYKLQQLLFKKIPKEKIHLGKSFSSYRYTSAGKIEITFEDQSTFETDFLIGADGIHSKVRQQLFPKTHIRFSGQTCWRGTTNFDLPEQYKQTGMELWGTKARFGISKIDAKRVYWFAVINSKPNQNDNKNLVKDKLLTIFSEFDSLVKEIIASTDNTNIIKNDIIDLKPPKSWQQNAVCLLGDAAHATTPNMGQGGAQAIEDAYYLSALIAENPKKNNFTHFEKERISKATSIVKKSWSTGKIAHLKYGKRIRNFLLRNVPKKIMHKQMMKIYSIKNFDA